jgi:PAS domain S-box-containing protein
MWVFEISTLNFLDVNEAALRHYGYSRNEFMQMTVKDIRPPEELERLIKYFAGYQRGNVNSGNWKHLKKDGTIIEVEINSHDINYNGKAARLVLANDITDKLKAQRLIIETSEQLRQLSARLQDIREEERMHMAHEIHDELGQRLTVLKMDISWLSRKMKIDDETAKEKLKNTLVLLDGTIKIVRKIATDLRPGILDDLGLIPALEWQSKEFEERSGIKVNFKSNISEIALATPIATGLFRIFQESLTNVGRHSRATKVESELVLQDDNLTMSIYDDGKGFDTSVLGSTKTLGIMGMKERTMMIDGEYTITSAPGKGTKVIVKVPMKIKQ